MLNEPTLEKLQSLKLSAMATAWTEQQKNPRPPSSSTSSSRFCSSTPSGFTAKTSGLDRCLREARLRLASAGIGHRFRSAA